MQLDNYDKNGVTVITVTGYLDAGNAAVLRNKFQEFIFKQQNFVIDVSGLDYIDSTGLGCLVSCLRMASESGGCLKLSGLHDKPQMLFEITKAYKIFALFDSVDAAIASFQTV